MFSFTYFINVLIVLRQCQGISNIENHTKPLDKPN